MKLTLEPTAEIASVDGAPARVWKGTSDAGVEVKAWIRCVQAQTDDEAKLKAFDVALQALPQPKHELVSFDMRFAL